LVKKKKKTQNLLKMVFNNKKKLFLIGIFQNQVDLIMKIMILLL
jgi:hypothetical protein